MTDKQALQEARRRWGRKGTVIHHQELQPWAMPYSVGILKGWFDFEAFGHGMTWERAFAAAEGCEQAKPEVFERAEL